MWLFQYNADCDFIMKGSHTDGKKKAQLVHSYLGKQLEKSDPCLL